MLEFYIINRIQMRTRGEGVKKSKNFGDFITGGSLTKKETDRGQVLFRYGNIRDGGEKEEPAGVADGPRGAAAVAVAAGLF